MTPKTTIPRTTHQKALNAAAALNRAAMKLNNAGTLQSILSAQEDVQRAVVLAVDLRGDMSRLVAQAEKETREHLEREQVLQKAKA